MPRPFLLLFCVLTLNSPLAAQLYCGWNPDANGDGAIGAPDLLALLSVYDLPDWNEPSGPEECNNAETFAFDGVDYSLVVLDGMCWFAENLRTAHYANGDLIPGGLTDAEWTSTTEGAQDVFNSDDVGNFYLTTYGRLYNAHAVLDERGVCPAGWHVSSSADWDQILSHYGGSSSAAQALKASPEDNPGWDGTNESGFGALPGGLRSASTGYFGNIESYGFYWTSTESDADEALYVSMLNNSSGAYENGGHKRGGFSVRCVLD